MVKKIKLIFYLILFISPLTSHGQAIDSFGIDITKGLYINRIIVSDTVELLLPGNKPLYSFLLNNKAFNSGKVNVVNTGDVFEQTYGDKLTVVFKISSDSSVAWKGEIEFENKGEDTVIIANVVPFGEDSSSVYITGKGNRELARAYLFRPACSPLRVILPDNAWEMGYSSFPAGDDISVCSIARRIEVEGGSKDRYETVLPPNSKVTYSLYAETFRGEWQNGLKTMFRDRYLYDLKEFDNSLYERPDLAWIKESYLIVLQMAWDREFYDRLAGKYNYGEFLKKGMEILGKIDIYGLWTSWPRLGLDQRSQWDMYRNLPGGVQQLRSFVKMSQNAGTKFFIAYNPWDQNSEKEDHYAGLTKLISETEADGVIIDTESNSSFELQAAADSVRKGIVMYSEGMAVASDMPGIISGRVHNAIHYSPELNLNKLMKPDFSIFRVCDIGEDIIHREIAVSFFNGYGIELNMFRPGGRGDSYRDDLSYLARTTFIQRQNNDSFLDYNWTPMIRTTKDNIYVNRWKSGSKTLYTILNMRENGFKGNLFNVDTTGGKHYISLWNHENIIPVTENGQTFIPVNIAGWQSSYSGTRMEGSVDCIAELPLLLKTQVKGDSIEIRHSGTGKIIIWKGNPSYQTVRKQFEIHNDTCLRITDVFGSYEGKIIIQLIENERLKDQNIIFLNGGEPWLISKETKTSKTLVIHPEMVLVPAARITLNLISSEDLIPYPDIDGNTIEIDSFLIDRYPVTNSQYYEFIQNSGYRPSDTSRYLKHWQTGMYKQGQAKYPVVYVSYEDAKAYAKWAEKRLPSQAEWQLAAQGTDNRKWPWGEEFHGAFCNNSFNRPTPVDAFPKGQSPYGATDMVGNVWQMTNDLYFNGANYFLVIRGGSYYKPETSLWYLQGGPQSLDKTQTMLMVSPGFDRSSTVGFRCVKDVDSREFRIHK